MTKRQVRVAAGWVVLALSLCATLYILAVAPIIYFVGAHYSPDSPRFTIREIADFVFAIAGVILGIWLLRGAKK